MVFYAVLAGKLWSAFGFIMTRANALGEPAIIFGIFLFIAPFIYLARSVVSKSQIGIGNQKRNKIDPIELDQSLSDWLSRALLQRICEPLQIKVKDLHTRIITQKSKWIFSIYMAKLYTR